MLGWHQVRESVGDAPHVESENEKVTRLLMRIVMNPEKSQEAQRDVDERGTPEWTGSKEDLESRCTENGHLIVQEMGSGSLEGRAGILTGILTAPRGRRKTRHDTTLPTAKQMVGRIGGTRNATHTLRTVDRKDGAALDETGANPMMEMIAPRKRRIEAMREGERPVGVMKRDGSGPLGDDKVSGPRMMAPMMNDVEAQREVGIREAIHPEGTGTEGEDAQETSDA
jgi:hypothetical protein